MRWSSAHLLKREGESNSKLNGFFSVQKPQVHKVNQNSARASSTRANIMAIQKGSNFWPKVQNVFSRRDGS